MSTVPTRESSAGESEAPEGALAVVALGANLGDPDRALRRAAESLARLGTMLRASELFETEPVGGPPGQPTYRNAVVVLRPAAAWASPERLLHALLALETAAGRQRNVRWGPRLLDLDLISFGDEVRSGPDLVLPHPSATQRPFVMIPLAQVWPSWRAPDGRSARTVAAHLCGEGVATTGERVWPDRSRVRGG